MVTLKIYQNNIRGFASKKESLEDVLENKIKADIVILNETATRGKTKIKLKNYLSFTKNNPNKLSMGGVSTSVASWLADSAVRVSEDSEGDEYLVTRIEKVCPALNIINVYGQQECRDTKNVKEKIMESWSKIKKELCMIEMRGEAALLIGDVNRAVGADELGVKGNKEKVSFGGELVRDLVESKDYVIFNNLEIAVGGPWTREDPADGGLSCLDLAIGSVNLLPFLRVVEVDSRRKVSAKRVKVNRKGEISLTFPDHFPVIVELEMPTKDSISETKTRWNTNKPGGWEKFKETTDKFANEIKEIVNDYDLDKDMMNRKVEKIDNKIKYIAFGKTKVKAAKKKIVDVQKTEEIMSEKEEAMKLLKKQSERIEEHINTIRQKKQGRCTEVFKMREVIMGPKKSVQEAMAIKDFRTGDLVVNKKEIKNLSLEYCLNVLTKNELKEDFINQHKLKEDLLKELFNHDHDHENDHEELNEEEYWTALERLKLKNKRSYDFIVKSGDQYKEAIFGLCKRVIDKEEIPEKYDDTILVQIYKGIGSFQDLSHSRYVHTKLWAPRLVEGLLANEMKEDILMAGTIYQIGGKPGMRTEFHLFVIKSLIAMKKLKKEGLILTTRDIQKFFDKESLVDTCVTLARAEVKTKRLRTWWKMNQRAQLSVLTGSGQSEEGEARLLVGQGGILATLASQLNLDMGINDYFKSSKDEECYGSIRLQPLTFQDDELSCSSEVRQVRAQAIKMNFVLQEKGLEIHPEKSGFLAIGCKKFKDEVAKETKEDPIMFGDIPLKEKVKLKYLGDILDERGLTASVEETIRDRTGKVRGSILELTALSKDFRMEVVGGVQGAIDLWEICIVPSLLSNCGVWTEISENSEKECEDLQSMFVRSLFHLPASSPIPALRGLTGMLSMKARIWEEKLTLILAIQEAEGSMANIFLEEQVDWGWPGLAKEVTEICDKVGLPDIVKNNVTKKEIKEAVFYYDYKMMKEEMKPLSKLDSLKNQDLTKPQRFLAEYNLDECRMAMRLKMRMLDIAADMPGKYLGREGCKGCSPRSRGEEGPEQYENRSHLEECDGFKHLWGDEMDDKEITKYFMRLMKARKEMIRKRN